MEKIQRRNGYEIEKLIGEIRKQHDGPCADRIGDGACQQRLLFYSVSAGGAEELKEILQDQIGGDEKIRTEAYLFHGDERSHIRRGQRRI